MELRTAGYIVGEGVKTRVENKEFYQIFKTCMKIFQFLFLVNTITSQPFVIY